MTVLLGELSGGRRDAFGPLVEAVYDDLHAMARGHLQREFRSRLRAMTINPTQLADDAVMALMRQRAQWKSKEQFFAIATRLMLRIIADYQRARLAKKRGGGNRGIPLEQSLDDERLALETASDVDGHGRAAIEAIRRLHESEPRKAEVVTLHLLGEHPLPRVADLLDMSLTTIERDWRYARAWLVNELGSTDE